MDIIVPSESNIMHVLGIFPKQFPQIQPDVRCQVSLVISGFQLVFKIKV